MPSSNPVFKTSTFLDLGTGSVSQRYGGVMSLNGTINKTGILVFLTALSALFAWSHVLDSNGIPLPNIGAYILGGSLGGFIFALITIFKKDWSPYTAPIYAVLEGLFLGALSAIYEARFNGIVFQAVLLTFATLAAMLLAYRSGMIRATEKFKMGVFAATGGIALFYLVTMLLRLFHVPVPIMNDSSPLSIALSVIIVGVAALNLILDFDSIEQGIAAGAPKYMEWYGAFGLIVTLVWLYLEFIRLLSKIQSRN